MRSNRKAAAPVTVTSLLVTSSFSFLLLSRIVPSSSALLHLPTVKTVNPPDKDKGQPFLPFVRSSPSFPPRRLKKQHFNCFLFEVGFDGETFVNHLDTDKHLSRISPAICLHLISPTNFFFLFFLPLTLYRS